MDEEKPDHINLKPHFTHRFVYKSNEFNVNLFLLSSCSSYFEKNFSQFQINETIYFENIEEDDMNVSDFIQEFFDICHFHDVKLTDDNVLPLHYISCIFSAKLIKEKIEKYINQNHDRLAVKILQFNKQNNKCKYEIEIIAKNLIFYIDNYFKDLQSFPINIIYEIIQMYNLNNHGEEENEKIINFMFDCLNLKGRDASILFSCIEFSENKSKYIKKLINNYKKIFDFNYINGSICTFLFSQKNEIDELKEDNNVSHISIANLTEEKENHQKEIRFLKMKTESLNKNIKALEDIKEEKINEINELKEMNESCINEIDKLQDENQNLKKENNQLKINNEFNIKMIEILKSENLIKDEKEKTVIYQDDQLISYKLYEKQNFCEVVDSPSAKGNIIIPTTIVFSSNEYKVSKICDKAFASTSIESISFLNDSSLQFISECVFENSTIQKFSLPPLLNNFDKQWFLNANKLNEIENDNQNPHFTVENNILIYQNGIDTEICFVPKNFEGEFLISEGITRIRSYSFSNLNGLNSIKSLSSTLTKIDSKAFYKCENLKSVILELDSIIKLEDNCFFEMKNLSSVKIFCKEAELCDECFHDCQSLNSLSILKSENVVLNKNTISNIKSLKNVVIDAKTSVKLVDSCFLDLQNLTSICIRADSILIENNCFMNCTSLSKLTIENSTNLILCKNAFKNCKKLKSINFNVIKELRIDDECFIGTSIKTIVIQGETIKIGNNCFKNCKSILSLMIPLAINVDLGSSTFEGCSNIQTVKIDSESKLKILDRCFYGDKNLSIVQFNCNELIVGKYSFYNCASISSISLPNSVKVVFDDNAFEYCVGISTIDITAQSEFQAGINCFYKASKLDSVHITSEKVAIFRSCFNGCSSITSFAVTSAEEVFLDEKAFEGCKNLENVDVSAFDRFKASIFCFNKAYKLKTVKIDSRNILYGGHCFENCSSLSQVDCPSANEIIFYKSSFNGMHYSECLKCLPTTKIKLIENKPNQNENDCNVF